MFWKDPITTECLLWIWQRNSSNLKGLLTSESGLSKFNTMNTTLRIETTLGGLKSRVSLCRKITQYSRPSVDGLLLGTPVKKPPPPLKYGQGHIFVTCRTTWRCPGLVNTKLIIICMVILCFSWQRQCMKSTRYSLTSRPQSVCPSSTSHGQWRQREPTNYRYIRGRGLGFHENAQIISTSDVRWQQLLSCSA